MTLRGRFGITGSHREVSGKVLGNIGKDSGDTGNVLDFIEVVSVKELCQGIN
jgi:hypothetical protein